MILAITCQKWLESVLKNEIKKLWYKIMQSSDTIIYIQWDDEAIAKVNLRSRIANKVYIVAQSDLIVDNFDDLYEEVFAIEWDKYYNPWDPINIYSNTKDSQLTSTPAIQSICKKAIVKKLQNIHNRDEDQKIFENPKQNALEVKISLFSNSLSILINTSGESLHKRWYKQAQHQAPINESLAAAMVQMLWWKFTDILIDPCCGGATLLIEAAMIAKRIAPGANRNFAFEKRNWYDKNILRNLKKQAEENIIKDNKYYIYGGDIDGDSIDIARQNIAKLWLQDDISIEHQALDKWNSGWLLKSNYSLICNPPYGHRIGNKEMNDLYMDLISLSNKSVTSLVITNYEWFETYADKKLRSSKNIYNGGIECKLWKK